MMPPPPLPKNEADRIAALYSYHLLDTALEDTFDNFVMLAAQIADVPVAMVSLLDKERAWVKAVCGMKITEGPRSASFCSYAILDPQQPLVVADATVDTRFSDNPWVLTTPGIRFYAGVPLVNHAGHALGTLCLIDYVPRQIAPLVVETLVHLAHALMTTIQLRHAMEQIAVLSLRDPSPWHH